MAPALLTSVLTCSCWQENHGGGWTWSQQPWSGPLERARACASAKKWGVRVGGVMQAA